MTSFHIFVLKRLVSIHYKSAEYFPRLGEHRLPEVEEDGGELAHVVHVLGQLPEAGGGGQPRLPPGLEVNGGHSYNLEIWKDNIFKMKIFILFFFHNLTVRQLRLKIKDDLQTAYIQYCSLLNVTFFINQSIYVKSIH